MTDRSGIRSAELLVLLTVVIWGGNTSLVKWGIGGFNLFLFNAFRYIVATATVGALFLRRASWQPVQAGDWPRLIRLGIIASVLYQIAFIVGLLYTSASNSLVLLSTSPLWTMVIHARMHGEKIVPRAWWGVILSFAGILLIIIASGKKPDPGNMELPGNLISLGAAVLWGLNANLQKPLLATYSPVQVSLVSSAVGALGLNIAALPVALHAGWGEISPTYYLVAVVSGSVSIATANVFYSVGVKRLGPARIAPYSNLVPVVGVVIASIALGEEFLPLQLAGSVVTVAGVWIARR